jgi:hypothetical protein
MVKLINALNSNDFFILLILLISYHIKIQFLLGMLLPLINPSLSKEQMYKSGTPLKLNRDASAGYKKNADSGFKISD